MKEQIVKDLEQLKIDLIRHNKGDTVWVGKAETVWDRIERLIEKYRGEDL